jgi:autotransporter-associated beta strand protein
MKRYSSLITVILSLFCVGAFADIWDPNGAIIGSGVSGNWDVTTTNWTATADSGVNTTWTQGNQADFLVYSNYIVTLTAPITVGNLVTTGTNATLTISGSTPNALTLGGSALFSIAPGTVNLLAPIGGAFDITKTGVGSLVLSNANTYSGGTFIGSGSGTIGIGAGTVSSGGVITSGPLGTGTVNVNTAGHVISAFGAARIVENAFTLNAGLTIGGTTALTFRNGPWQVVGGTRILTVNNTALTTLESPLTDDGSARTFQKAGSGKLAMNTGATTTSFLGGITASAGTLVAGSGTPFPTNNDNNITLTSATLDLNGFDVRLRRLAGNAASVVQLGTKTLTAGGGQSAEFLGSIKGTGGYVKVGSVSQVLSGTNTFSGGILIAEGALYLPTNGLSGSSLCLSAGTNIITITNTGRIGANRSTGLTIITNKIVLANTGPTAGLDPANGNAFILSGPIVGTGGLLRYNQGGGLPIITGSNTFSGGVEIDSRTLGVGNRNAFGTGPLLLGNPAVSPGNLILVANNTDLSGANAIPNVMTAYQNFGFFATNKLEMSGSLSLSNNVTITCLGDSLVKLSGQIDGDFSITVSGTNALTLSRANIYTGTTAISGTTLFVNNTTGSGTGTNTVTATFDGTLAGTGTVAGPVTVSGGGIGGGVTTGILTVQSGADLSSNGTNVWELAALKDDATGVAGVDYDQLAMTGGNLVLGGSSVLRVRFVGIGLPGFSKPFWQSNHVWKVISLSGGAANPGSSNFSAMDGTNGVQSGTFSTLVDGGGNVFLSYAAAPLPPAPVITNVSGAGTTSATLSFSAVNGVTYEIQYKTALNDANWTVLGTVTASGSTASFTDTTDPVPGSRFYRIVIQ